ncbi:MAG: hypothetical protein AAGA27_02720 [Pseudomonadota bacterium]
MINQPQQEITQVTHQQFRAHEANNREEIIKHGKKTQRLYKKLESLQKDKDSAYQITLNCHDKIKVTE